MMAENQSSTAIEMDSLSKSIEDFDNTLQNLPVNLIRGKYDLHMPSCKKDCSNQCCTDKVVSTFI